MDHQKITRFLKRKMENRKQTQSSESEGSTQKNKKWVATGLQIVPAICAVAIAGTVVATYDATIPDLLGTNMTANAKEVDASQSAQVADLPEIVELPEVPEAEAIEVEAVADSGSYADGVYEGTGSGYQDGTVTVQVTITGGQIAAIDVLSYQYDGESYMASAKTLISTMLAGQTTNVDTVSGATYSCRGLISAVRDALSKAATNGVPNGEQTVIEVDPQTVEQIDKLINVTEDTGGYKDGTYTGSGIGFQDGTITVKVVIKNGKMKKITIESYQYDGAEYIKMAKAVVTTMIKDQTTNVDTVSGATYSSNGIISAVRDALSKAKKTTDTSQAGQTVKPSTQPEQNASEETIVTPGLVDTTNGLIDGTYTGTGKGFLNGAFKVQVTIKAGKMSAISILSYANDGEEWIKKAETMIPLLLKQQNTNVDTVSGATYSSRGLLEAVADALKQAAQNAGDQTGTTGGAGSESDSTTGDGNTGDAGNADEGTEVPTGITRIYEGTATCTPDRSKQFTKYTITVQVTTVGERITAISRSSKIINASNRTYSELAEGMIFPLMIKQNTTEEIDVVSGATCSSNALIEAVQNALASEPISVIDPAADSETDKENTEEANKEEIKETD